jgi:tRNA dimethylallyltransferase
MTPPNPTVFVIGGPTASGKSAYAMALAERVGGEIVGADSRQLYQGMRIASAGPDDEERQRVPHHLYAHSDPATVVLSAGSVTAAIDDAVTDILRREKTAIIVGGTGLYLRAFRLGLDTALPADDELRAALRAEFEADGLKPLVSRLYHVAPKTSARIDLKNPVRVLRALEIALLGGDVEALDVEGALQRAPRPIAENARFVVVDPGKDTVDGAIDRRCRRMFESGILDEAKALRAHLAPGHDLLRTIGIEEALDVVDGKVSIGEAVASAARRTRQYAKRQRTWFRKEPWWTMEATT